MKKILFLIATFLFAYDLQQFVTCKNVKNLTPIDINSTFNTKDKRVYAFAYFKNIEENRLIDFIWEKNVNGIWKIYADVKLPIYKGFRWRTYSYITLQPYFKGKWRISLYDGDDLIAKKEFEIK